MAKGHTVIWQKSPELRDSRDDRNLLDKTKGMVSRSSRKLARIDDIVCAEVKRTKYPLWFSGPHYRLALVLASGESITIEPDVKPLVLDSAHSAANAIGSFLTVEVVSDTS